MEKQQFYYDNKIVRNFIYASIVFGVVGMLVGLILAFLFLFPNLTSGVSFLSFGRLRPLHTNAVIFASLQAYGLLDGQRANQSQGKSHGDTGNR